MKKSPENLLKYLHINFQIWFPKYNFKNPKYIKNIQVCSLRTPDITYRAQFEIEISSSKTMNQQAFKSETIDWPHAYCSLQGVIP